ncbi:MAG: hypothetical protein D6775_10935 [Caldilineae bacterium]|nr:MAG: hypothetical protein D6775_10935 [Caldilineae bacterium]
MKRLFPILGVIVWISILLPGLSHAGSNSALATLAPRATPVTIDVDLPSTSTHTPPSGTLALRISAPASPADARYPDGAPVVIYVPGGTSAGTLRPPLIGADDVIRIAFLFPGGSDPAVGRSSDGTYDYRGPDSIAALRDVALYAAGLLTDSDGHTIDDVVPVNVLHDNIGFYGSSNGGNISVVTADLFGSDLNGYLKYIIQWESPVSSQMAVVDLGPFNASCPPPQKVRIMSENPWYDPAGYTPFTVTVDYSAIAYDATGPVPVIFLDGTGDGSYTTVPDGTHPGCFTPDLDGDGVLTRSEDVPLGSYGDGTRAYFSAPATKAMQDQGIFGTWPVTIANLAQANTWWGLREAVRHYAGAVARNADLEGMVLASVGDHVQIAADKPHIRQAFDGWDDAGAWVKINPARSYAVAVNPALSGRSDLPDNAANTPPADWSDATSYAYPDGLESDYAIAAVYEMADRAHAAGAPTATSTATATATASPTPSVTPTPTTVPVATETQLTIWLPVILKHAAHGPTLTPTPTPTATPLPLNRPQNPQIGLNFIHFYWEDPPNADYFQPEWIFNDFAELGVQAYRQFIKADMLWDVVEPQDDQWNWSAADAVIPNADFEPIVTLFALQYASATPPWATTPAEFQKTLGPEAQDYLQHVIDRYGDYVKYWEIGNEMDHWRAADPTPAASTQHRRSHNGLPPSYPVDGFSPQEQGVFLAQVADFIRARDPDAVIIMPGMGGLSDYGLNTWLAGVIDGGGSDWFDVINYHFYGPWYSYPYWRGRLAAFIADHGLSGKTVWNTETGSTASPTLTQRTDYPNSTTSQAADVFRRIVQAYGYGDSLVLWHTYIGSPDTPNNAWRLYGIRTDTADAQPSYYSFGLLVDELIPFSNVAKLASSPGGKNVYRFTTEDGATKVVVWGSGTFTVPPGISQMTSVVPNPDGSFSWQTVTPGQTLTLSDVPVLLQ